MHGAVTFALAYTLDQTLISSGRFHFLFSEAALIIFSLLIPTIIFRFILPRQKSDEEQEAAIDQVKVEMVNYTLSELKKTVSAKEDP